MTPAARVQAAIDILDDILEGTPAEKALTGWARRSRFAGSKDRAAVRDHVFDALRRRNSAAFVGGDLTGRGVMIGVLRQDGADLNVVFSGAGYGPAPLTEQETTAPVGEIPLDLPEWLQDPMRSSLGAAFEATHEALRGRAPVILRVNLRKATRAEAQSALLQDGIETRPMDLVDTALEVTAGARRIKLNAAYLEGLVELQDASSQALVAQLPLEQGLKVLDYCAGGGGKTLAMAGRADATFFAYDALEHRMSDLPARAKRAGVAVQVVENPVTTAPYDMVVCDVPCSGSGTWRRAPDAKWRFAEDDLAQLEATQAEILDQAKKLVAPGGVLIYATCSVLSAENTAQIDRFVENFPDWEVQWQRQFALSEGGDGFFGAILRKK
ncbi:RsmB/NOP family class I SAM-dependent RNA methyltransferase [Shimia sagamensis]|uniref:16S rRNA (Cytosine967-C5)-methyltransferase n=1 Tax=Shimia sagamensis TaxID=1566352 RepID=A0ABY1PE61_9RHOB|nr:RsmB/NOP family class I SAM-dependent RNA methyltransferase [Shimia sagamensis]SMP31816.1 16S rRNA (cytosine967-C5)-methyltransferase [Shimia sagamensis]